MEDIKLFVLMYWQAISLALSAMLFAVAVKVWWEEVRYFFMRISWSFPLLGGISRAGRSTHKLGEDGWYPVETQLCGDFYRRYKSFNKSPDYYEKCDDYLNKAEELGRSEKGLFLWSLIIGLILLEAVGFAYVLAPFMAKNASSNEQTMLAWFVALLLSIAAVFLTELTGKELHKNELINKIREWWSNERESQRCNLQPEKNISIDKTYGDNNSPKYIQLLNRVPANATVTTSFKISIVTAIYIISLAVGAYLVRSYTLDAENTESVNQAEIFNADAGASAGSDDPFAVMEQAGAQVAKATTDGLELPAEMAAVNENADKKAKDEAGGARGIASKVTFIILSIIYVMIQVVGIYFGYAFSLFGKESAKARHYTKDFNSAEELNDWLKLKRDLVSADAESYLQQLQEKLSHRAVTSVEEQSALKGGLAKRTFFTFLARKKQRETEPQPQPQPSLQQPQHSVPTAMAASVAVPPVIANVPEQPVVIPAVAPVTATEAPIAPIAPAPQQPAVATVAPASAGALVLPPELADIDLCRLDDEDLAMMAADFGLELDALKRSQRLLRLKQKAGSNA